MRRPHESTECKCAGCVEWSSSLYSGLLAWLPKEIEGASENYAKKFALLRLRDTKPEE